MRPQRLCPLSLRLVLIVPFILQIMGAVSLVGYLSFRTGQKATSDRTHIWYRTAKQTGQTRWYPIYKYVVISALLS
ncbi:MAG: hypothetical protein F6J87_20055 [Spirulina sp. SIO3F2]|nr:hypothetical protein [Spirulina sp. SIO3F2]